MFYFISLFPSFHGFFVNRIFKGDPECFFYLFFQSWVQRRGDITKIGNWVEPYIAMFLTNLRLDGSSTFTDLPTLFSGILGELAFIFSFLQLNCFWGRGLNIHFMVFSQHLPGVIAFFLPNQKSSVGWQGGRSVGYFKGKSNDRFTFMLLCLGRNQLRSSAAYRRINVFSGYDVTCILPYIHVLQVGCRHHIQPYSFACIIVI